MARYLTGSDSTFVPARIRRNGAPSLDGRLHPICRQIERLQQVFAQDLPRCNERQHDIKGTIESCETMRRARDEQRKFIKYNHLVANLLIDHNVVTMSKALERLATDGYAFDENLVSCFSPYLTEHINRLAATPSNGIEFLSRWVAHGC